MVDAVYWIWFQQMFGIGTERSHKMMENWKSPQDLYQSIKDSAGSEEVLSSEEHKNIDGAMQRAEKILYVTQKKGCEVVAPDNPLYPQLLLHSYARPAALYVKGDISCLRDTLPITMVGTRNYTSYGEKAAGFIAGGLAQQGAVIVSGLANGIDSLCHGGALLAGGKTVGVLACGLDIDYPKGSAALKRAVRDNGAVISEYPMGTKPIPSRFPPRNRVMAGMSRGVVVVEAGENSGALITARLAADAGREVFAVPGSIFAGQYTGSHKLIQEGAKLVASPMDILVEYPEYASILEKKGTIFPALKETLPRHRDLSKEIDPQAQKVYDAVEAMPKSADVISALCGVEISMVLASLTVLEILGAIKSYPGGLYGLQ